MNERQWEIVMLFIENTTRLLEEIAENTRSEEVDEKTNKVTGFSAGEKKNV